uniref:Uncharacterized protein n=1 Tax=Arundo donax TaxID=35708 RepID=A0A0A9BBL1_ARUDO
MAKYEKRYILNKDRANARTRRR